MRVALLNPPWLRPGHYGVRAGSRWPHFEDNASPYMPYPFYLGYAAALLEQDGFAVCMFDGCATRESDESFMARVKAFAPDMIVQENATASIQLDLQWAQRLKEELGVFLLMTGHHVDQMKEEYQAGGSLLQIDALAGGEWEYTVLECARALRDNGALDSILGLIVRQADGSVTEAPVRPNVHDLDALPFPHRRSLDMTLYHDNPGDLPSPCLQLHGSRGCPYTCNFCVWPQVVYGNHRYRTRSAKSMADEIEKELREGDVGYRSYYFDDDTFNIGNQRLSQLADELIYRGLEHIPWGAMCRADTLKGEVLAKLRRAGLHAVKYGVESGNEELLFKNGKRLKIAKLREMMDFTHSLGIKTHLTFSFGLIGETHDTMKQTLNLALELDPHTVQFSICTPFPGTEFYDYAKEHDLLLTKDYSAYDGMSRCVVRADEVTAEELEDFLQHANKLWHEHVGRRGGSLERALKRPVHAARTLVKNPGRLVSVARGFVTRQLEG